MSIQHKNLNNVNIKVYSWIWKQGFHNKGSLIQLENKRKAPDGFILKC